MGFPLSPIITNLFMEKFEQKALNSANPKPEWWTRFVDDTFLIWAHGKEELEKFVEHLNKQTESIKFMKEFEENNALPFLDTLLIRKQDGSISHKVYRKGTHTEQYLHALSHHHPNQKMGVLNTLFTRALRVSDNDHLDSEIEHLRNVFLSNGYNIAQINKALEKTKAHENRPKALSTEKKVGDHKAFLPYIQGITYKIDKHLKKKDIDSVFSPPNSIKKLLRSVKDPVDPSLRKGVYLISCECGKTYIGETGRSIRTRVKEHSADIRLNRTHKSALA